ncbi:hypothetical protein NX059_000883 [Plenodomus lindquistii]|nr:hypothetical protein NX059_000883 [Plenodomus lindquistii]
MKNLWDAIHAIYRFALENELAFWADFICIDQSNVDERGRQVQLMNTTYRAAESVAIWLGPAEDDSEMAIDMIHGWNEKWALLLMQNGGDPAKAAATIESDNPFFAGNETFQLDKKLKALCKLLTRAWWTRAWIVQEGSVAHSLRTMLFCGDRKLIWEHFRAARWIAPRVATTMGAHDIALFRSGMAAQLASFRTVRGRGKNVKLLDLLCMMRPYRCEDPRDKVSCEIFISGRPQSLEVLGLVARSASETLSEHDYHDTLPSWVPDWTSDLGQIPFRKQLNQVEYLGGQKAYGFSSVAGRYVVHGSELKLQGSILTSINSLSDTRQSDPPSDLEIERSKIPTDEEAMYFNGQPILEAFNHTLVADIGSVYLNKTDVLSREFSVDWALIDSDTELLSSEQRFRKSWLFTDIGDATFGRRFCTTDCGYMGLAPAAAQVGDKVCVFFGGQVLYVIRDRADGRFEFVGECYVHGMMDGLACEVPWFEPREFVLV